jgi:hypothetical protein
VAFASALFFMGIQISFFGIYSLVLNNANGILKDDAITEFFKNHFSLEKGLLVGACVLGAGLFAGALTFLLICVYAHNLDYVNIPLARLANLSIFTVLLGIQLIFSSFFISLFNVPEMLK